MDVKDLVQNQWLTSTDVNTSITKIATIIDTGKVTEETNQKGEKYKALVLSVDIDRQTRFWKLNKYSLKKLSERFGIETTAWLGKQVKLTTMLMQGGKMGVVPE